MQKVQQSKIYKRHYLLKGKTKTYYKKWKDSSVYKNISFTTAPYPKLNILELFHLLRMLYISLFLGFQDD